MLEYFTTAAVVFGMALANMWVGWDKGDRYTGTIAVAGLTYLATQSWAMTVTIALSFLVYRSIGWYGSIDMGRNEGAFARDFAVKALITTPLGLIPWAVTGSAGFLFLIFGIPLVYVAAMWGLPWRPGVPHIKVAEGLTGAAIALTVI